MKELASKWPLIVPLIALGVLATAFLLPQNAVLLLICGIALLGAVISAVHHAEIVAHQLGEPFGTLVLALAVTVIETALILFMMAAGGEASAAVVRDTVYAAVMIICNGVVGLCLLAGGLRHVEQSFRIDGTGSGLAALAVLSALVLVEPALTVSVPGTYTTSQLIFVAISSLALWLVFVFIQTIRHRDYFLPSESQQAEDESTHAAPPGAREAWQSFALLSVCLISVVGLAKVLSPSIERAVVAAEAPVATVGVLIAMIVLLPETGAALRAAQANRLQASLNLAIGSAMASIGLTVPVVVCAAIVFDLPLMLGLGPSSIALLALTFIVGAITLGTGRTNMMQGAIHLIIFAAFLILTLVP